MPQCVQSYIIMLYYNLILLCIILSYITYYDSVSIQKSLYVLKKHCMCTLTSSGVPVGRGKWWDLGLVVTAADASCSFLLLQDLIKLWWRGVWWCYYFTITCIRNDPICYISHCNYVL